MFPNRNVCFLGHDWNWDYREDETLRPGETKLTGLKVQWWIERDFDGKKLAEGIFDIPNNDVARLWIRNKDALTCAIKRKVENAVAKINVSQDQVYLTWEYLPEVKSENET